MNEIPKFYIKIRSDFFFLVKLNLNGNGLLLYIYLKHIRETYNK